MWATSLIDKERTLLDQIDFENQLNNPHYIFIISKSSRKFKQCRFGKENVVIVNKFEYVLIKILNPL